MKNLKIAKELLKIAKQLMFADDYEYIYDPDHTKRPGGGYVKTESGWSKGKQDKKENNSIHKNKNLDIPSLDKTSPMTEREKKLDEIAPFAGDWDMRSEYAAMPLHPKTLDKMSRDRNLAVVNSVAMNSHTHPSTLDKLSNHPKSFIRKSVAQNLNTHIKTLEKLSRDSDENVSKSAKKQIKMRNQYNIDNNVHKVNNNASESYNKAMDENSSPKLLDELSNHEHYRIRETVARNPNTSEKTLRKLSSDEKAQVRAGVAGNSKTDSETLDKLANDKEKQVKQHVAENPRTSSDTLDKLANDSDTDILECVAENPNTSTETLKKLSNHKHHYVREKAKNTLSQKNGVSFDISKLSPEIKEKVKDWDEEDIKKFIGWLKEHKE